MSLPVLSDTKGAAHCAAPPPNGSSPCARVGPVSEAWWSSPTEATRQSELRLTPLYGLNELLTPDDVAAWLKVSVKWVYDHTSRCTPKMPHLRLGGHLRFRRLDVERWLDSQQRAACA